MFKLCDLTRLRIAQDLDKFCAICVEPPFPRKRKQQQSITDEDGIECWCKGIGTKDDPSEDDGKKYCGCALGEAAFRAACRAHRALKTGGLEE